jgi:hypothetical protein
MGIWRFCRRGCVEECMLCFVRGADTRESIISLWREECIV